MFPRPACGERRKQKHSPNIDIPFEQRQVIKKRFETFISQTAPVIERFAAEGILRSINAERSREEVWEDTRVIFV